MLKYPKLTIHEAVEYKRIICFRSECEIGQRPFHQVFTCADLVL